ncbi:similar to Saccharomyces cerevisiae YCR084C TUP1 General repressor of transcription [Maudiozyma saulgeensis]|uniref:Similar to Saccharomyces cerevisiae YCR084C TUP1 General repressor of transcription n=1 Tax=Maudiozyma saulgeensis TaxID=1789683 RepID=A0A1X7R7L5_9SACH|nr:similar to Saccharomyces cerevisiae YCR084C TUP1 General repressor of transcription [Kazachstania saulgeensis]
MSSSISDSQGKLNELLESIRKEFNNVSQEANSYRLQNQKDFDYKINQNLAEMQQIRNTVYELELSHRKLKDSYQEEINRLKLEISQKDQQIATLSQQQQQLQPQQPQQPLPVQPQVPQLPQVQSQTQLPQVQPIATEAPSVQLPGTSVGAPKAPEVARPLTQGPGNGPTLAPLISALGSQLQQPQTNEQEVPKATTASIPPITTTETAQSTTTPSMPPIAPAPIAPAGSASPTSPVTKTETTIPETKTEKEAKPEEPQQATNDHYLVPYDQRASQVKPIPPFLLDLDSQQVPDNLKKQAEDYYVLYNPALPRSVDVDLLFSLDHTSVVCCVKFSNDGEYLATGCNKTTQVYKVSTGELVAKLMDDNANPVSGTSSSEENGANGSGNSNTSSADLYIRSVCFSPDGKYLATGAEDRLIRIWDIAQAKIVMVLQGHDQDVYSLDYFPSGDKLVSGSGDRTVRMWDLKTGQCSLTLSIEDGVTTVAVSPGDGKYIAAGSLDRAVRVWDSETGFLVERLDSENELGTGHKDSVYSVVFTRNGNKVVSGSLDRTVKLWNLRNSSGASNTAEANQSSKTTNGTCEVTYVGHKDFVLSVTTTANDQYILSGSKDRGVLFWDTPTGNPLLMLQGHKNSVISVAVANGKPLGEQYEVFATGSGDCRARIWKFSKTNGHDEQNKISEA